MGLINFRQTMPADVRRSIGDQLYGALEAEKENLPDGVIMTLITWGDADRVRKVLGDKLRSHNKEVAVLERISSRDYAVARLWEIYEASPPPAGTENVALSRRWHVGHALICRQDKRGIDILVECLTVKEAENADRFSFRHSLHNTFLHLASVLNNDFGYPAGRTWTPQLNEAIPKMVEWWKANREQWSFGQAASKGVPKDRALPLPAAPTGPATRPDRDAEPVRVELRPDGSEGENAVFLIGGQKYPDLAGLRAALQQARLKSNCLLIAAQRNVQFRHVTALLKAAVEVGFEHINFAVPHEDGPRLPTRPATQPTIPGEP